MPQFDVNHTTRAGEATAVIVRDAAPGEHGAIRAVLEAAYRQFASQVPASIYDPYIADILDLDTRARDGRLLVAERAGHIVGTVTFYDDAAAEGVGWPAGWAGLRALGVDPAARGLGIGRLLMDACVDRARQAGASVLCLHTAVIMTAAIALYERMGFQRVPEFDFTPHAYLGTEGDPPTTADGQPVLVIAYRLDL
jgi:ribosomal protein S18 acetylase RimI-like enzyme